MTNDIRKESATIIQFPVRTRGTTPSTRIEPRHEVVEGPQSMAVAAALDGAWYHTAALRDDQLRLARR